MAYFRISGGIPLSGSVRVGGAKNAALPMMAAAILAEQPVRLQGVPRLTDVHTLSQVLRRLGLRVARTGDDVLLETVDPTPIRADFRLAGRMRASFCVLGPLLARRGRAMVPLPGGCNIGDRPVDLHLKGLAALGAEMRLEHGWIVARTRRLAGAEIDLCGPYGPTVTGTANVLSAAVLARGTTIINGAATEPEIVDLGELLNAMGARIGGLGSSCIRIEGVRELGGATHRVIPDRIEAATLLLAAAISRGSAVVAGLVVEHLTEILAMLQAAGFAIATGADWVSLAAAGRPRPLHITARPYPGIPSDVQAQWLALLALARGRSTVRDAVFPQRFLHVAELRRLGAAIDLHGATATITGAERLAGAHVTACDLRASAALVLAGLAAEGETLVRQIHHLDRGYERLERKLSQLGARIQRGEDASVSDARAELSVRQKG